jgi:hypothetical protein
VRKIGFLIVAVCVVGAYAPSLAIDLEEIMEKHVLALGGKDRIQAVQTMRISGRIIMGGLEYPITIYHMRPNRLRIESRLQGQEFLQVYDGEIGWHVNPMVGVGDPQRMTDVEIGSFKLQADMDGLLVGYQDKGYKLDYVGEARAEGAKVFQMKLVTPEDVVMDVFVDARTFCIIKVTTTITHQGRSISMDTLMSDYRDVGGMMMAHTIDSRQAGQPLNQVLIDEVVLDFELDEALFEMPPEGSPVPDN